MVEARVIAEPEAGIVANSQVRERERAMQTDKCTQLPVSARERGDDVRTGGDKCSESTSDGCEGMRGAQDRHRRKIA
jgi:hypothetical protein